MRDRACDEGAYMNCERARRAFLQTPLGVFIAFMLLCWLASMQRIGTFIYLSGYLLNHHLLSTYSVPGIILVPTYITTE